MSDAGEGKVGRPAGEEDGPGAVTFDDLCRAARAVVGVRRLSEHADAGQVGAAILSDGGRVYTGISVDTSSSMGFCAEHAAAAAMLTAGESRVVKMLAVDRDGQVVPPCGRCREFIRQLHPDNLQAEVLVAEGVRVRLRELLPHIWQGSAE